MAWLVSVLAQRNVQDPLSQTAALGFEIQCKLASSSSKSNINRSNVSIKMNKYVNKCCPKRFTLAFNFVHLFQFHSFLYDFSVQVTLNECLKHSPEILIDIHLSNDKFKSSTQETG